MKRTSQYIENTDKKQRKETINDDIDRIVCGLKKDQFGSEGIDLVNKFVDIINYCITHDDIILLELVVKKWDKFKETFEKNKVIYKRLIFKHKAEKCYMFFKIDLCQNFKPEEYYNNAFYSYVK